MAYYLLQTQNYSVQKNSCYLIDKWELWKVRAQINAVFPITVKQSITAQLLELP
jgi:hypothetical protein